MPKPVIQAAVLVSLVIFKYNHKAADLL